MQSYLSILCRLFRCNWTTLFVGWQGLGVFSPWRYDQEASQALFTEKELGEYCIGRLFRVQDDVKSKYIIELLDELSDVTHVHSTILERIRPLADTCEDKVLMERRKWQCAILFDIINDPRYETDFDRLCALREFKVMAGPIIDMSNDVDRYFSLEVGHSLTSSEMLKKYRTYLSDLICQIKQRDMSSVSTQFRNFTSEEKGLISFLMRAVRKDEGYITKFFSETQCFNLNDGGMGSLRFMPIDNTLASDTRKFGHVMSSCNFNDEDGVLVSVALYADSFGNPFELDVWKVDFSPLVRIPSDPSKFTLDDAVG